MNPFIKTLSTAALLFILVGCGGTKTDNSAVTELTVEEARAIAHEAYVYGFPLVDNYRVQYAYFVDNENPEFKATWNNIKNTPRVYTYEDKAVLAPNSDTPYSHAGLDLRAEPVVLTIPTIDDDRYYSVQLIDNYTHNFGYIGSRTTGSEGGTYLIAGPEWDGEKPEGISSVIQSETEFVLAWYRTQLFNSSDLDNVKAVQAGYKVQTLSDFLGIDAPKVAKIDFIKPLSTEAQKTSPEFFNLLNFTLQFCPTHPSEIELMKRFAKLGIGANGTFDVSKLSPEIKQAVEQGIADAWEQSFNEIMEQVKAGEVTSADAFGTREHLNNDYLIRWAGVKVGIYANSKEEAIYPVYYEDSDRQTLVGSNNYTYRFEPGMFPPVNAFWSITMYEMPTELMIENPINRYLINAAMLPEMNLDADGGLTVYIQNESPGKEKESNWLPAPEGAFRVQLRLYSPKEEALNGSWKEPLVMKNKKQ